MKSPLSFKQGHQIPAFAGMTMPGRGDVNAVIPAKAGIYCLPSGLVSESREITATVAFLLERPDNRCDLTQDNYIQKDEERHACKQ